MDDREVKRAARSKRTYTAVAAATLIALLTALPLVRCSPVNTAYVSGSLASAERQPHSANGKTPREKAEGAESKPGSESQIEVAPPKSQGDKPSGGNANSNTSTGGSKPSGGNSGGASNGGSSKPSHTHTWVEQTTQQWVPNNVWVVDQAAWDEVVPGRTYVLCTCGATFGSNAEWSAHNEAAMLQGDKSHRSSVQTEPSTTIHHDEIGHWEDQGHNETVVTGYKCSGCGATR